MIVISSITRSNIDVATVCSMISKYRSVYTDGSFIDMANRTYNKSSGRGIQGVLSYFDSYKKQGLINFEFMCKSKTTTNSNTCSVDVNSFNVNVYTTITSEASITGIKKVLEDEMKIHLKSVAQSVHSMDSDYVHGLSRSTYELLGLRCDKVSMNSFLALLVSVHVRLTKASIPINPKIICIQNKSKLRNTHKLDDTFFTQVMTLISKLFTNDDKLTPNALSMLTDLSVKSDMPWSSSSDIVFELPEQLLLSMVLYKYYPYKCVALITSNSSDRELSPHMDASSTVCKRHQVFQECKKCNTCVNDDMCPPCRRCFPCIRCNTCDQFLLKNRPCKYRGCGQPLGDTSCSTTELLSIGDQLPLNTPINIRLPEDYDGVVTNYMYNLGYFIDMLITACYIDFISRGFCSTGNHRYTFVSELVMMNLKLSNEGVFSIHRYFMAGLKCHAGLESSIECDTASSVIGRYLYTCSMLGYISRIGYVPDMLTNFTRVFVNMKNSNYIKLVQIIATIESKTPNIYKTINSTMVKKV